MAALTAKVDDHMNNNNRNNPNRGGRPIRVPRGGDKIVQSCAVVLMEFYAELNILVS
jgi:hypothetical protein